jgi:hypothetical protein
MSKFNVVPFKAPDTFKRFGIDWTREPATEAERTLRETFLIYESFCGGEGLASILLLATVSRRQGSVAKDLQEAADFAEIILAMKVRKHQDDALEASHAHVERGGVPWS